MSQFLLENSGKYQQLPPPDSYLNDSKLETIPGWRLLGHTKHAPFRAAWEDDETSSIAVMFEGPEHEVVWWHFIAPD